MGDDMRTVWCTANGVCTYDTEKLYSRVGYTGHVQDDDCGLVYAGARYLDPIIGRFLSIDPDPVEAGKPQTFNRYAYANNNPFRFVDPTGRDGITADGNSYTGGEPRDSFLKSIIEKAGPVVISRAGAVVSAGVSAMVYSSALGMDDWHSASDRCANGGCYYADKTDKPKAKASSSDPGDIIRTPTTHPDDFSGSSNGSKTNTNTGEIWSPSNTKHYGLEGEWKVGSRPGVPARPTSKITVTLGGKIIKVDK